MRQMIFVLFFLIFNSACVSASPDRNCTQDEARKAEIETSMIKDIQSLLESFQRYGHCDDGAIAEGYSAAVVRLLTVGWDKQIVGIYQLTESNRAFKAFFLHHIDELMTMDEQQEILNNVKLKCPETARTLCTAIENAAK
ncbi:MAG: hypothetical protein OEY01_15590 [Desulfobulbaceae bacterium]|nr:hypothetical protein [Desulfobulbaceae bacterium]